MTYSYALQILDCDHHYTQPKEGRQQKEEECDDQHDIRFDKSENVKYHNQLLIVDFDNLKLAVFRLLLTLKCVIICMIA